MFSLRNAAIFGLLAVSLLVVCKIVGDEEASGDRTVASLAIKDGDVTNWKEENQGYRPYTQDNFFDIINGGADEYINRGLIEGFQQILVISGSDYTATFLIMDMNSDANAKSMFDFKADAASTKEAAGNYSESTAVIDAGFLSGCTAYAHFEKFYLELLFTGYASNLSEAKNNAVSFLEIFKNKIDKM
jgi:hypothetical protein